jgi:hypothetical protein
MDTLVVRSDTYGGVARRLLLNLRVQLQREGSTSSRGACSYSESMLSYTYSS